MLEQWGFPAVYVTILANHHLHKLSLAEIEGENEARAVAVIHLANSISRLLGYGFSNPDGSIVPHELVSSEFLGFDEDKLIPMIEEISETYEAELDSFQ